MPNLVQSGLNLSSRNIIPRRESKSHSPLCELRSLLDGRTILQLESTESLTDTLLSAHQVTVRRDVEHVDYVFATLHLRGGRLKKIVELINIKRLV